MSRRNAMDVCLLCEESPCRCGKPPKPEKPARPKKPRAAKPKAEPATEPKCNWCTEEERAAGMKCACLPDGKPYPKPDEPAPAEPHPLDTPPPVKASARAAMKAAATRAGATRRPVTASDPVMDDAIRALDSIMHPDERSKYRMVLSRPRSVTVRATAWIQRRVNRRGNTAS